MKYFIVSTDLDDYMAEIERRGLPPGQCFVCFDAAELASDIASNLTKGIDVQPIFTPAWTYRVTGERGTMAQAPAKTYTDTLLDLADLTYKARLRQGQTKAQADAAAMRAVVAAVKEDIQEELRADRWGTAAAILDLWASERGIPLTEEKA